MSATQRSDGRALVARLLADPPQIHAMTGERPDAELGVWKTETEVYDLIADRCGPGSSTLETGIGLSTALFAGIRADHVCVSPLEQEAERLRAYCARHDIATDTIDLVVGFSDEVLPRLPPDPLDFVLIDGGHGFPMPMVDWYYSAGRLRRGGVLVIDDVQLPAVGMLARVIDADERWRPLGRTEKWVAYERAGDGSLREDWWQQPSVPHWVDPKPFARRVAGRLRRAVSRG